MSPLSFATVLRRQMACSFSLPFLENDLFTKMLNSALRPPTQLKLLCRRAHSIPLIFVCFATQSWQRKIRRNYESAASLSLRVFSHNETHPRTPHDVISTVFHEDQLKNNAKCLSCEVAGVLRSRSALSGWKPCGCMVVRFSSYRWRICPGVPTFKSNIKAVCPSCGL